MLHNSTLAVAQPTIVPMAATTTTIPVSSSFIPQSNYASTGFESAGYRSADSFQQQGFQQQGLQQQGQTTVVLPGGPGTTTTITQQNNRF